jgi:hypothetical protein
MTTVARDQHRRLDREHAETCARDGGSDGQPDIARPRRWRQDAVSGNRSREPKVLLMQLTQRTSGRGTTYMTGWLGKAKLVAFKGEPDEQGNERWDIYAAEPQPRGSWQSEKASA